MRLRLLSFFALSALCTSFWLGCGPRGDDRASSHSESPRTLRLGNSTEPATLDPQLATGEPEFRIIRALFRGLVKLDPDTLQPVPDLAESWDRSEDGLTYRFTLRPDLTWSDGQPLTSADLAFAVQRLLTASLGAPYSRHARILAGGDEYFLNPSSFDQVGLRLISPREIEFTLATPSPLLLKFLAHPALYPLPRHAFPSSTAMASRGFNWIQSGQTVPVSGPFQLDQWRTREVVRLTRNPLFFEADRGNLTALEFLPQENPQTEERAFRDGRIHVTANIPLDRVDYYLREDHPALRLDPDLGTYYLLLNLRHPVLADVRVRQALSLALDREAITRNIRGRGEAVAWHFTPPEFPDYSPPPILSEDASRARELLAEAGFPGGQNFPTLRFLFNISETHAAIAEAIQDMWRQNLGIDLLLENREWGTYLNLRREGNFDMLRASWLGDFFDPATFLEIWTSDSVQNFGGYRNPRYDELIHLAGKTDDPSARTEFFFAAESLLLEEVAIIPIFFLNRAFLLNPRVVGWSANPLNLQDWGRLSLRD
jgi:oligopeptide transport system substrate-binding protein